VRTSPFRPRQGGAFLIVVLLILVTVGTVIIATGMLEAVSGAAKRAGTSQLSQMSALEDALVHYVAVYRRLPCPADGTLPPGDANRGVELRDGDGICTSLTAAIADQQTGVVPWVTLGLSEVEAISADATMFSYRIYSGPKGLSQDNGADMSPCDTDNTPNADAALAVNGQCESVTHDNTPTQFLQGKGLSVNQNGAITAGVAFVLIHHGANGKGAFLPTGPRKPMPANTNVMEYPNTRGTNPATYAATYFTSTPNILADPDGDSYFDDRVAFLTIQDLARKAALSPRNWPDDYLNPGRTSDMTNPSTDPLNPHFMSTGSGDTAFQATTSGGETTVTYGAGGGNYAGCLWWPNYVTIFAGTNRYRWTLYTEFAMEDHENDVAQGFTIGMLPFSGGQPNNSTCGDAVTRGLGWSGGTLASTYLNRVATEVDVRTNTSSNDPAATHLAIDYGGTTHGTDAESCTSPDYGRGCDAAGGSTFLHQNNLSVFHSMRLEVVGGCTLVTTGSGIASSNTISVTDQADIGVGMAVSGTGIAAGATVATVGGGAVTLSAANTGAVSGTITFVSTDRAMLKVWVLSYAGCSGDPVACDAMKDVDVPFSRDVSGGTEALHIKRCLPLPEPATDQNAFYFGITTANRDRSGDAAGANLAFRELRTALRQAP
jgi:hypothetical protein